MPILRSELIQKLVVVANVPTQKLDMMAKMLHEIPSAPSFDYDNLRAAFKNAMQRDPRNDELDVVSDSITSENNLALVSRTFRLKSLPVKLVESFTKELKRQTKKDLNWLYLIKVKSMQSEVAVIKNTDPDWNPDDDILVAVDIADKLGLQAYVPFSYRAINVALP